MKMKKLLFTLTVTLCSLFFAPCSLQAQTIPPPYINYQAVLYDVNGPNPNSPLINQSFSTFVNINDELGNLLYREEHYASTDANGLITVKMGDGLYTAGPITNFNQINWGVGKYYLVVDFDINGTISSTAPEQLVTVPYSFYAGNAGNGMTAVADNGNGTLTFTYANGATYTTPTLSGIQGPAGPVGPTGATGADGQSAYDLWLAQGNIGTVQDFLSTSAYQIWLAQGNTGTAQDFLNTLVGPSGPQGPQGFQGLAGNDGATGPQGPQGPQGIQGVAGPSGASGTAGPAGDQGINGTNGRSAYEIAVLNGFVGTETQWLLSLVGATGPQGIPGTNGANGATGPQGQIGLTGPQGSQGIQGPAGNDGATGSQGPIGLTGPQGPQGIQGPAGNDGATGPQGPIGLTGPQGAQGIQGPAGSDGATGSQGPIGLTGPQGPQGIQGPVGNDGATGPQGPAGSDGATGSQGPIGLTGPQGPQGIQGPVGNDGATGPQGAAGNDGATGPQGPIGLTGPQGPQGIQGPAGSDGATGSQGPIGLTGPQGPQGIQGPVGNDGATGPQGPAGNDGATGPQGPIGLTGPQGAQGLLDNGVAAGNTPYWNGTQWVVNGTNFYNNGASVGVGTNIPANSAQLDVSATDKGFLAPRLTTAQRDVIVNPDDGLIIFNISSGCPNYYFGGIWFEWCGTGVLPAATISSLDCGSSATSGTLTQSVAASNVSATIPYSGANGGTYLAQSFASTGVAGLVANLASGTLASGSGSVSYTISGTPASVGTASFNLLLAGQTCTLTIQVNQLMASLTALNCAGATTTGSLLEGTLVSAVSASVPYTGGNGGSYAAQTISSTGVTGLTATLTAGILANGSGSLSFAISGTPATSGTASFALTIGGQSCSFTVSVQSALAAQYPASSVFCASGPTAIVNVTNPTTGKIWMDRNLGASQAATSSTDAASYGDLYQWGRGNDGHQCRTSATAATLSSSDTPGNGNFILAPNTPFDWRSPQNANLWQGVNGVNNPCPTGYRLPTETELNAERLSWSVNNASGAYGSPLKLTLTGSRDINNGNLIVVGTYGGDWSSTVSGSDSRGLDFDISGAFIFLHNRATVHSIRCIKDASAIPATLGAINCGSTSVTGTLTSGTAASGVSASVPYTGGNGGSYAAQTISSTGVTGLTATLTSGILANGSGSLLFAISGTPATSGTASFALTIGGQSCSFTISVAINLITAYPANSVFCASGPTAIVDVTNPTTGKIWMDRNLGASQAATSSTDAASYGDLYQWGRGNDGHQCRTSATTSTLSSSDTPGNANFITAPNSPFDWRSPQNANLWQGVNGVNNPCPTGYRLPTSTEWNNERISWTSNNSIGAINSALKLPMAGFRSFNTGTVADNGLYGDYWSSTFISPNGYDLDFNSANSAIGLDNNAGGYTVRCIKDASVIPATLGAINCGSTSVTGTLTSGTAASGVSASVPYTGGNGGSYAAQTISSTGVTGLTATLTAGILANGAGSLSFAISGTPATSGTASFALTIGGQSCSFTVSVQSALVAQYPSNSVFCASGATAIVDVTNPTTGKIWMDRNLGASQVATSSTDAAAYGELYQWGRKADGHQCRNSPAAATTSLSFSDQPSHGNFIITGTTPYDWRSPQNTNLWQGVNGVNNPCPSNYRLPTDVELEAERLSWSGNSSSGAILSPLKWTLAGLKEIGAGQILFSGTEGYYWSNSVNGIYSKFLYFTSSAANIGSGYYRAGGLSVRCIKDASAIPATLGAINCGSTSVTGTLTSGTAASGVSASVPYTGGNGGSYAAQTISSTGVTGLTATLTSGTLAFGSGSLSIAISGTPATSGTASFALTIGGQSCSFTISVAIDLITAYPTNSVFCASGATAIVDVTNPTTGKIWMDRNLGASQAATSSTDAAAYGDLYQWGRGSDGHQCRTSATTATLSSTDTPANGNFILNFNLPEDWRNPQNNNLWQGVNGLNNPCPSGYRIPTDSEWSQETLSFSAQNAAGAFASLLKLSLAGGRNNNNGSISTVNTRGRYWSSSRSGGQSGCLIFDTSVDVDNDFRASGKSVRCIKN